MGKVIALAIFALIISVSSTPCIAKEFIKDGYEVEIYWKLKGSNQMSIWGSIEGGEECKQLNLSIFLKNSKNQSRAHIEVPIYKYKPNHRRNFSGKRKVCSKRKWKNNWFFDEVYFDCKE